jgi:sulfoxide reductase heme-binding subunit YedZ
LTLAVSPLWYLTRGAGVVSLLLLTASVLLGLVTWSRWTRIDWPRYVTHGLHRNVALLAVGFVSLHVVTSVADGYAPIRLLDAVVPFVSRYRPLWLGLGALAFDLLIALIATSLLRRRLGWRAWRTIHWLTYACFGVAVVHGLGTGSDPRSVWFAALTAACVVAVLAAGLARILRARAGAGPLRAGAAAGALTGVAALVVWAGVGPLRTGWAARAGTPRALLAAAATSREPRLPAAPFQLPFQGRLTLEFGSGDAARLVVDAVLEQSPARLQLDFDGRANEGSLVPSSIVVRYGDGADRYVGSGRLRARNEIVADVSDGTRVLRLTIGLALDIRSQTATGVVQGSKASV